MSVFQDIRSVSSGLSTSDLLRFLIEERFPGAILVTASLKAPGVAVLRMIADIDRATPVVFCTRGFQFPASLEYRERIVDLLGLQNVSLSQGHEFDVLPGDHDHRETMWAESWEGLGRSYEILHLNQTLAPYDCWISAVNHMPRQPHVKHRVDVEGRLIRVDPVVRWSKDDVRTFMRKHSLPFHPHVTRPMLRPRTGKMPIAPTYAY